MKRLIRIATVTAFVAGALVWGDVVIDEALAARLSKAFGTSEAIWLRLEANYRRALKRRQEDCS